MVDRDNVIKGLECIKTSGRDGIPCHECPYVDCDDCEATIATDAIALIKEQKEERKRMLLWLSRFCRHIDNGDKWLTDEENLAFFREKMKLQFGWDFEDEEQECNDNETTPVYTGFDVVCKYCGHSIFEDEVICKGCERRINWEERDDE